MDSGYEINEGEIWEVNYNGDIKTVVTLACFANYAATITLQDNGGNNYVEVKAREIMYADAGKLGYVYYNKMIDFVRMLSDQELHELKYAIAAAIKLPMAYVASSDDATDRANDQVASMQYEIDRLNRELGEKQQEIENQEEELEEAARRVEELEEEKTNSTPEIMETVELIGERSLREDLAAAVREAAVYKHLYEDMLARALA